MLLTIFIIRSNERSIDWQNNLNLFTSAIRVCPNNAKIYYNLAQIMASNGDYNKSLEFNLIANDLNPNNVGIRTNLGTTNKRNFLRVFLCCKCLSIFFATGKYLGNAYRHVGNVQAAMEHHKAVVDTE